MIVGQKLADWNRNSRPQPQTFSRLVFLVYLLFGSLILVSIIIRCLILHCRNWLSGALVGRRDFRFHWSRYCTPELATVNIHWKLPLRIQVRVHRKSENPWEHATET